MTEQKVKLSVKRTEVEKDQIINLMRKDTTFRLIFTKNYTQFFLDDLHNRLYGKIPRNWVINITGLIGTPTGIFKSSMGLQIALSLDPSFNLKERVAFTINQLLDKIREFSEFSFCQEHLDKFKKFYEGSYDIMQPDENAKCRACKKKANSLILMRKLIFFLDELTHTLKIGDVMRLKNIIDACRERQLCFFTCGIPEYDLSFSTYSLQRVEESDDKFLPLKRVRYAVRDSEKKYYYGYFVWDVIPLTNPEWNDFWGEYSVYKTRFQRQAIAQQVGEFGMEKYAQKIRAMPEFEQCFYYTKKGIRKLHLGKLENLIVKFFPDFTHIQRKYIKNEIIQLK
jgi:hypothetical protein